MAVKDIYMVENKPRVVVEFSSPIWRRAKDLEGEKVFANFLRRALGWKHFWQGEDIAGIEYSPPFPLLGKLFYREVIGMKLVGDEWMVCVEAQTHMGHEDILNARLVDAVAQFCQKKKDWDDLFL